MPDRNPPKKDGRPKTCLHPPPRCPPCPPSTPGLANWALYSVCGNPPIVPRPPPVGATATAYGNIVFGQAAIAWCPLRTKPVITQGRVSPRSAAADGLVRLSLVNAPSLGNSVGWQPASAHGRVLWLGPAKRPATPPVYYTMPIPKGKRVPMGSFENRMPSPPRDSPPRDSPPSPSPTDASPPFGFSSINFPQAVSPPLGKQPAITPPATSSSCGFPLTVSPQFKFPSHKLPSLRQQRQGHCGPPIRLEYIRFPPLREKGTRCVRTGANGGAGGSILPKRGRSKEINRAGNMGKSGGASYRAEHLFSTDRLRVRVKCRRCHCVATSYYDPARENSRLNGVCLACGTEHAWPS